MPLTPATRLGAYEVIAPLGAGGMGEVYRARDTRLGRDVALKVLPADVASRPDRLARFEREARMVAALNHPSIVTLHSIEEADGIRFLTMELVEGQSLDRHVAPGGLPVGRVVEIGIAIADALTAAHEKGVVHRDLKPANLIVTRDGRVKVLDFGLAKLADTDSSLDATQAATVAAPLSTEGQVVGTVPYMSPEQIRGGTLDARSDLFSLGIVLYELASGRRPFAGATAADISSAILRDAPEPLVRVRSDLPVDIDRIVSRCLEKDPRARFQTALDVVNELRRLRGTLESGVRVAPAAATSVPSIAVLPFANRSGNPEDEYFSDGLADELLNVLAKIRGLRVAARTSSFQFKDKHEDLATIGQKLNVATLLEGSVRKAGNRVRISVQLVKVEDGFQLWSETYDRTLDDIFAVQDDIAQSVVKELRTTLLGESPDSRASGEARAEVAAAAKGRGHDAEAHRLYLQGTFFTERITGPDLARGIEFLREALARDPGHARAWAALSRALVLQAAHGYASTPENIARAREAAQRALELEPDLALVHLAFALIQTWHDWDWKGAEASIGRALALAPTDAEALRSAGMLAYMLGHAAETLDLCRRAVQQDPLNPIGYTFLGRAYTLAGQMADAERSFRTATELSPDGAGFHYPVAMLLFEQGRLDEALAEAERDSADWARRCALAIIHDAAGRRAESDRLLHELIRDGADSSGYQIAQIYAERGDADAAFEWLERGYATRDSGISVVKATRRLRKLHGDPRWLPFLRKVGLVD